MPETTFRTFESDAANAFAAKLAQTAAELDNTYSPVVLFGEQGSGKSHLLDAIVSDLRRRHPEVPFLFLSGLSPVDYLLPAPAGGDAPDKGFMFRPYEEQQILLVDDIERFLTQDELRGRFEQLFDAFYETERLIILACAASPDTLEGFDKRFLSRLSSGVNAEVGLPGPPTRVRILKQEAEHLGFPVEAKALQELAAVPVRTVGELVELFRQVRLYCVATGQPPSMDTLKPLMEPVAEAYQNGVAISAERWCADWYGQRLAELEARHQEELRESRTALTSLEAHVAEEEKGKSAVKAKVSKAAEALRTRETELQKLRAENKTLTATVEGELPRLREVIEDKDARLADLKQEAEAEVARFQARLAEVTGGADAARAEVEADAAKANEEHATEVLALEKRLEEIYESLNDTQQDFAIQNQNKDKLLDKLSNDYQKAKEETDAVKQALAEQAALLTQANASGGATEAQQEALEGELQAIRAEAAAERQALETQHTEALGALRDEAAIQVDEMRRQLEAKEGALASITEDFQKRIDELDRTSTADTQLVSDLEAAQAAVAARDAQVAELEEAVATQQEVTAQVQTLTEQVSAGEQALAEATAHVAAGEQELAKATAAAETATNAHTQLQRQLAELQAETDQYKTAARDAAQGADADVAAELEKVRADFAGATAREAEAQAAAESAADAAAAAEQHLEKLSKAMEVDVAVRDRELALMRKGATDAEHKQDEHLTRITALERELEKANEAVAAAAGGAGTDMERQFRELQAQLEAREHALETLQESFGNQITEATAKARDRETALSGTVRDLQAQLNAVQVGSDDEKAAAEELRDQVATLNAQIYGTSPAAPESDATAAAESDDAQDEAPAIPEAGVPTPPPLANVTIGSAGDLDPAMTFDAFQPAGASTFSLRSAQQVCDTPGELYNPLVVYGPAHAGKTHILHAVGNAIAASRSDLAIVYATIETLMVGLDALDPNTDLDTVALDADVLLLDNFVIGQLTPEQQNRLANVLTNFVHDGRQLALASPVPPVKITGIERDLMRFLEEGLLAKFEPNPDVEVAAPPPPEPEPEPEREPEAAPAPAPTPTNTFADLLAIEAGMRRDKYRGPKVFDDFLKAYQAPNKSRRSRFPLIVADDDQSKRHHFFHALANELSELFPTATVALLSCADLVEAMRQDPAFDVAGLTAHLCGTDLVLVNDGEALTEAPVELARMALPLIQNLLAQQILLTLGLSKADKRDKIFGEAISTGSKKKI